MRAVIGLESIAYLLADARLWAPVPRPRTRGNRGEVRAQEPSRPAHCKAGSWRPTRGDRKRHSHEGLVVTPHQQEIRCRICWPIQR